ncbi:hypothetical protein TKK_0018952 [Trichogramma kaykai]
MMMIMYNFRFIPEALELEEKSPSLSPSPNSIVKKCKVADSTPDAPGVLLFSQADEETVGADENLEGADLGDLENGLDAVIVEETKGSKKQQDDEEADDIGDPLCGQDRDDDDNVDGSQQDQDPQDNGTSEAEPIR